MSKKILVTGANGFLGRELTSVLELSKKYSLICHVGKSDKTEIVVGDTIKNIFNADISDYPAFLKASGLEKPDVVVHTAGLAHQFGKTTREEFWRVNVFGTENVCRLCAEMSVRRLILISSVAVYGDYGKTMVDERFACRPSGDYAQSKFEAEERAAEFCSRKGIELTIIRPATIIGEGDRGNTTRLIKALNTGKFLWIGDGSNRKTLIYKNDVARGIQKVIEGESKKRTEIYNLVSEPLEMREVVEEICRNLRIKNPRFSIPAKYIQAILKINERLAGFKSLNIYGKTINKWLADDLFSGRKFHEHYGFAAQTTVSEAISRQVDYFLKSQR